METKLCQNCGELVDADYDIDECPNADYVWKDVGNGDPIAI